ncbi:MAG: hypothetical protein EP344_19905 [Bacteroidetes bacterium]|nr:MAG: hypothetical protein EP344_19905 [Bacteroidota bacterium]
MKHLIFSIVLLGGLSLYGQNLHVGIKLQKTHLMYWENGISARYTFSSFKPGQFYVGLDYVTSRLGTALGSNALKQDNYTVSAAWYFRKEKAFRIVTNLNTGYFHADVEEEIFRELPHNAFLLSPEVGLCYIFRSLPLAMNLGAGYNINLVEEGRSPGTLQPLFYNLGIYYKI